MLLRLADYHLEVAKWAFDTSMVARIMSPVSTYKALQDIQDESRIM